MAAAYRYGVRYPAYHSLDVKINRYFTTSNGQVALFLEIINFYNHNNVRNYDYFLQHLATGEVVATRLVETWFPLLPSLGISWEFQDKCFVHSLVCQMLLLRYSIS